MSLWAEDPELFLHKGKDGVVHVLRCKKEMMTLSSSPSMLLKPEDFTVEGTITDHRSLTGGYYDWDKDKYEALIDYIYPRHLMVNCHGAVISELATDEKSVLAVLFSTLIFLFVQLLFNLFHRNNAVLFTFIFLFVQLLFNHFHRNKKAKNVLYIRALDILAMGSYGPGPDHPNREVPARMAKYLQDGTVVQMEPILKELKLSKEVETLQQELLLAKKTIEEESAKEKKLMEELSIENKEVETLKQELLQAKEKIEMEVAKEIKLRKEAETLRQELLSAKEKLEVELAKETKLSEELSIESNEVETLKQELLHAKEKIEVELAKEIKLTEELAVKGKEVETLEQERERLLKENTVRIYTKAATNCSLTIRNGFAMLGYSDASDDCQYWVKDDKYSAIVRDRWGFPSYALVNKLTRQALKPTDGETVELVHYNPNALDMSILWTDEELGDGYRAIRKATNPFLNLDAAHPNNGIGNGTMVMLYAWWAGDNQKWNIVSH